MKLIFKRSLLKKFAIHFELFLFISMILTFISTKLPEGFYQYKSWIYKERDWEKCGEFYQDKFNVKAWKNKVPELADFIKSVFPKKLMKGFQSEFMSKYLMESCKAEFTHWTIIFFYSYIFNF